MDNNNNKKKAAFAVLCCCSDRMMSQEVTRAESPVRERSTADSVHRWENERGGTDTFMMIHLRQGRQPYCLFSLSSYPKSNQQHGNTQFSASHSAQTTTSTWVVSPVVLWCGVFVPLILERKKKKKKIKYENA